MKRILLGAGMALASLGAASAADLAMPRQSAPILAPVTALPIFTWSGFYYGVHAGAAFTDNSVSTSGTAANTIDNITFARRPGSLGLDRTGFMGGVQAGYNWQMNNIVLGLETDISYVDGRSNGAFLGTTNAISSFRQDIDYLGTVRARVGYAMDRWMIYATGGLAYGHVKNSATFFSGTVPGQIDYIGSRGTTRAGYAVGGGVEYAINANWSVKGEYLYYDLGKSNVTVVRQPLAPAGGSYVSRFRNDGHIVRAGLNYKF